MRWLRPVGRLLQDRNAILILAFVLGLLLGPAARWTAPLTLPALAVVVAVSSSQVPTERLLPPQRMIRPALLAVAFSYLVNSAAVLLLSEVLVPEPELLAGFVLIAAAPPGAAVLPFTAILEGDETLSLLGIVGAYLSALVIAPLLSQAFLGRDAVPLGQFAVLLLEIVVLPLVVSRLLRRPRWLPAVERRRGLVVNWSFFVVILSVVAVNRDVFLFQPGLLARIVLAAGLSVFGLGILVEWALSRFGVTRPTQVSLTLFASIKNSGFAAATALALVGREAAIPGAVSSVAIVVYLIWLGLRAARRAEGKVAQD